MSSHLTVQLCHESSLHGVTSSSSLHELCNVCAESSELMSVRHTCSVQGERRLSLVCVVRSIGRVTPPGE